MTIMKVMNSISKKQKIMVVTYIQVEFRTCKEEIITLDVADIRGIHS